MCSVELCSVVTWCLLQYGSVGGGEQERNSPYSHPMRQEAPLLPAAPPPRMSHQVTWVFVLTLRGWLHRSNRSCTRTTIIWVVEGLSNNKWVQWNTYFETRFPGMPGALLVYVTGSEMLPKAWDSSHVSSGFHTPPTGFLSLRGRQEHVWGDAVRLTSTRFQSQVNNFPSNFKILRGASEPCGHSGCWLPSLGLPVASRGCPARGSSPVSSFSPTAAKKGHPARQPTLWFLVYQPRPGSRGPSLVQENQATFSTVVWVLTTTSLTRPKPQAWWALPAAKFTFSLGPRPQIQVAPSSLYPSKLIPCS